MKFHTCILIIVVFIVGLNWITSQDIRKRVCTSGIISDVMRLRNNYAARVVPYGRAYLGFQLGYALFYDDSCSSSAESRFCVQSCVVPGNNISYFVDDTRRLCSELSLHALLIGKEVVPPDEMASRYHVDSESCEWSIKFPIAIRRGQYELQIWTHSLQKSDAPTEQEMHTDKYHRHNNGSVVSLSGLSRLAFTDVYPYDMFDFTGHTIRRHHGPAIYLVVNKTSMRGFKDWDTFVAGGFDRKPILTLSDSYFNSVLTEITPYLDEKTVLDVPRPTDISSYHYLPTVDVLPFVFGDVSWSESQVFNLPSSVSIGNNRQGTSFSDPIDLLSGVGTRHNTLLLSRNSSLLSSGRWLLYPPCEEHFETNSKQQNNFYNNFAAGDICQQTEPVLAGDIPKRVRGMVWQPWAYDMVQFDTRQVLVPEAIASKIAPTLFCDIIRDISNSKDRDMLLFSKASQRHIDQLTATSGSIDSSSKLSYGTSLALCLKSAGIGFIAGFGDSLGVEQSDNFQNMIDSVDHWTNHGHQLGCRGSSSVHIHFIKYGQALVRCIEDSIASMVADQNRIPMYDSKPDLVRVPVKTIVLVTNFMAQHVTGGLPFDECEAALRDQARLHSDLAHRLLVNHNITYRRIFMSAVAIHGFKMAGLTNARQQWFNAKAREILGNEGGFEILDTFNVTIGRPDSTRDGTHYKGGVSRALTDILANMLCLPYCSAQD